MITQANETLKITSRIINNTNDEALLDKVKKSILQSLEHHDIQDLIIILLYNFLRLNINWIYIIYFQLSIFTQQIKHRGTIVSCGLFTIDWSLAFSVCFTQPFLSVESKIQLLAFKRIPNPRSRRTRVLKWKHYQRFLLPFQMISAVTTYLFIILQFELSKTPTPEWDDYQNFLQFTPNLETPNSCDRNKMSRYIISVLLLEINCW